MNRTINNLCTARAGMLLFMMLLTSATVWAWDGSVPINNSQTNPILIENTSDLDRLATNVNNGTTYAGVYFRLRDNITYTYNTEENSNVVYTGNYTAIGNDTYPFKGDFDGNKKTISGIRIYRSGINKTNSYQGIFGYIIGANIYDLNLADARITGYNFVGGIVGYNYGGTIANCTVAGSVNIHAVVQSSTYEYGYHGGIVGYNYSNTAAGVATVSGCTSAVNLTLTDKTNAKYFGGIAGSNSKGSGSTGQAIMTGNHANGAIVPAVSDNTYGALAGDNDCGVFDGNDYTNCTVGGVEGVSGGAVTTQYGCISVTQADRNVTLVTLNGNSIESATECPTITTTTVSFNRTFTTPYATFVVPFKVSMADANQAGTFYRFQRVNDNYQVEMSEVNSQDGLTANTPYIVKPKNTNTEVTFSNSGGAVNFPLPAEVITTGSGTPEGVSWTFNGTYAKKTFENVAEGHSIYFFAASAQGSSINPGDFVKVKHSANSYSSPFRAYMEYNGLDDLSGPIIPSARMREPAELPQSMPIVIVEEDPEGENVTTQIGTLDTRTGEITLDGGDWYTLDGRKLQGKPQAQGLYLHNGHKVVVK